MEFDHVKPGKKARVASLLDHALKTIEKEISLCELVCACCHRIRTIARRRAAKTTSIE